MVRLSTGFFSPLRKTSNPRRSGKPASISVANCRVKAVSTFDFTVLPPKLRVAGDLRTLARAGVPAADGDLPLRLLSLPDSTISVGK